MTRWLSRVLKRIRDLAIRGQVQFTLKAIREMAAIGAGLDVQDGCDVLTGLTADDFSQRFESERTGEWMYVFKPAIASTIVYLKVILRAQCLVISFHEDEGESSDERS